MNKGVSIAVNKVGIVFASMVVVPTLAGLSFGFFLAMALVPIAAILQVTGAADAIMMWLADTFNFTAYGPFVFNIGPWDLPDFLVIPVALAFAALFYIIARKTWLALRNYLKYAKVGLMHTR